MLTVSREIRRVLRHSIVSIGGITLFQRQPCCGSSFSANACPARSHLLAAVHVVPAQLFLELALAYELVNSQEFYPRIFTVWLRRRRGVEERAGMQSDRCKQS